MVRLEVGLRRKVKVFRGSGRRKRYRSQTLGFYGGFSNFFVSLLKRGFLVKKRRRRTKKARENRTCNRYLGLFVGLFFWGGCCRKEEKFLIYNRDRQNYSLDFFLKFLCARPLYPIKLRIIMIW
jgi:hypothetical protein